MTKSTKDVYLAAAFLTYDGIELVQVDRTDPRHMIFVFDTPDVPNIVGINPKPNLEEIEMKWVNNDLVGNLTDFKNAIQRMKSVIHSS